MPACNSSFKVEIGLMSALALLLWTLTLKQLACLFLIYNSLIQFNAVL